MSCENPTNSHCSRTYWTPTMEQYFIDLMLEHIHKGNRIGHTFNKQAWADMHAVFNAKFGSKYDKDVLKSRYTNLWKQFNDVKNLLGENGFSWDETRKMVLSDEYVWDAYIKIHPEAQPYKTKSVPNYDKLCLIYGHTVADGRYSRSSHDIDIEDETVGMNSGEGNSSLAPSSSSWTSDMDQYFMELMLNQLERGNRFESTFNKQAWTEMLTQFNAKFCCECSKRLLRQRYKKLLKFYTDIADLVKQDGFCWDEVQQMVVAEDAFWDAYIKVRPYARSYRGKVFPDYNNLSLIFGDLVDKESPGDCNFGKDIKSDAVGAKSGGVRPRTYWTPPMDRFLIDLMLEQVGRENRIGQSFITEAWNEMATSFNANFGSDNDKEVLKNRYKHFRKQYNEVKGLLEHSSFTWDAEREMVKAEDDIWDAYIKAHPDARLYRGKTVPYYQRLRVIYGEEKFSGPYTRLSDIDADVATPGLLLGEIKNEDADIVLEWTSPMKRHLIDLMKDQVQSGNKVDGTFNEQAWSYMTESFKEKFGTQYEQHNLHYHYLDLQKRYIEISTLLNQNRFQWDEARKIIVADNDTWESYMKEDMGAISYRDKVIEDYDDLCTIFGTEVVDKELSYEDLELEFNQDPLDMEIDKDFGLHPVPILEVDTFIQGKKRSKEKSVSLQHCSKVPKTIVEGVQSSFTNRRDVTMNLLKDEPRNDYAAIEHAIIALQAIPDIDDELLLDGCDLLEDEKKAKTFLALDASLRKKWLLRKLGCS